MVKSSRIGGLVFLVFGLVLAAALPNALTKLVATLFCGILGVFLALKGPKNTCSVPEDLEKYVKEEEEEEDTPGDIDAYENMYDLKAGGFSRVKMVRRITTRKKYALKLTNIHKAFDEGQVKHTLDEKQVLLSIKHPFIVKLHATFRDNTYVYFLLQYISGGELFDVIKDQKKLKVEDARFYAANVIVAIEYLHKRRIAFRDLKSENLLVDNEGYLKLIDFGMARYVTDRCNTFAGTLDYVSPEILKNAPYTEHVDWWALGCLIYEMLTGATPFKGPEEDRLKLMLTKSVPFGRDFDPVAKDLVKQLLNTNASKRLGSSGADAAIKIRSHPWFKDIDWVALVKRELVAPKLVAPPSPVHISTPKLILKVRKAVENDPPESPRTYSPKAIDTFFSGF